LTLGEMATIGKTLGFRLTSVKMTVSELASAKTPAILHFESHGVNSGQYMLFLWMYHDESKVALIDGARVSFKELSRDEFRRSWTGYALIAQPPVNWGTWIRLSAVTVVCVGLYFCLVSKVDRSGGWFKSLRCGFQSCDSTHEELCGPL